MGKRIVVGGQWEALAFLLPGSRRTRLLGPFPGFFTLKTTPVVPSCQFLLLLLEAESDILDVILVGI